MALCIAKWHRGSVDDTLDGCGGKLIKFCSAVCSGRIEGCFSEFQKVSWQGWGGRLHPVSSFLGKKETGSCSDVFPGSRIWSFCGYSCGCARCPRDIVGRIRTEPRQARILAQVDCASDRVGRVVWFDLTWFQASGLIQERHRAGSFVGFEDFVGVCKIGNTDICNPNCAGASGDFI